MLEVEQLLTTGGGWQDQCGGLYEGFKMSRSDSSLPLRVSTEVLPVPGEVARLIASHLVLVYTGKARLAKTLLQDVLRRWHLRVPEVVENLLALEATAEVANFPATHRPCPDPVPLLFVLLFQFSGLVSFAWNRP